MGMGISSPWETGLSDFPLEPSIIIDKSRIIISLKKAMTLSRIAPVFSM